MRTNLAVTNVEYPITDETLIVSKTDLKGKLTYSTINLSLGGSRAFTGALS